MTSWKISYHNYWRICGDGKEMAHCDNEADANQLLDAILLVENSKESERGK